MRNIRKSLLSRKFNLLIISLLCLNLTAQTAWVTNVSSPFTPQRGLQGHHLWINSSHGRYFDQNAWIWQRPYLFCTVEDLLSQSLVRPFLVPMLENAGAYVNGAKERDEQTKMLIIDNDTENQQGRYIEYGKWTAFSKGFAPIFTTLTDSIKPFELGTARYTKTDTLTKSEIYWQPDFAEDGNYAVYVSYPDMGENAVSDAKYTVNHGGEKTVFRVNQRMGAGTWVYLGTFFFRKDAGDGVTLSNQSENEGFVAADAVRFGGGMGINARGNAGTSGMPRFLEAARYNAQFCGMPDSLFTYSHGTNDYNDDIRVRGEMVNWLKNEKKVPFELSLAVHTDAGTTIDSTVVGSLYICTTMGEEKRRTSYRFCEFLHNQVQGDLEKFYPWKSREIRDKNYGETRIPNVPSAILECLSHQNFYDMKYMHEPTFKFRLARAIYKAVLRYTYERQNLGEPVVQPLPPTNFYAKIARDRKSVELGWKAQIDSLETTAVPTAYLVKTAINDGDFDNGRLVTAEGATLPINRGERTHFKVYAVNEGGLSFPTPTLSVYQALEENRIALLVDDFDTLCGPEIIETPDSIGFLLDVNPGVSYGDNTAFCGKQVDFDPLQAGKEGPGALGFSTHELEGKPIRGNNFNLTVEHIKKLVQENPSTSYSSSTRSGLEDFPFNKRRKHRVVHLPPSL